MSPFFCYFGGKWRAIPKYPVPEHDLIVEPFAGAAGYATRYPDRRVLLIEKDPAIAELWKYLIAVKASEVRALPLIANDQSVDDLHGVPPEAKALIGFWLNKGSVSPRKSPSAWMRAGIRPNSYWGTRVRERIAQQVERIRHWVCRCCSYSAAPDVEATWFIDPPYERAGRLYRFGSDCLDFGALSHWVRARKGLALVCESEGAQWLPFCPLGSIKANPSWKGGKKSAEVLYTQRSDPLFGVEAESGNS